MRHEHVIDIWIWSLDVADAEAAEWLDTLSVEETARCARFVSPDHRRRFAVAHGRMRDILAARLNLRAGDIQFHKGRHGKPYLSARHDEPPFFNLTHSHDLAALAVSDRFETGIDIERVRVMEHDIPRRFFSGTENEALYRVTGDEWLDLFYRYWTAKEAYVKARGLGLALPMDSFSVSATPEYALLSVDGDPTAPRNWTLHGFHPASGYMGAIAAHTAGASCRFAFHRIHDITV